MGLEAERKNFWQYVKTLKREAFIALGFLHAGPKLLRLQCSTTRQTGRTILQVGRSVEIYTVKTLSSQKENPRKHR